MTEIPDDVKRWTAKRRSALVVSILRGETSVQEAARKHGLTVAEIEGWRDKFMAAAEKRDMTINEKTQADPRSRRDTCLPMRVITFDRAAEISRARPDPFFPGALNPFSKRAPMIIAKPMDGR